MKKTIIFVFLLIVLIDSVSAIYVPEVEWNKTFGYLGLDRAYSVQQTSDLGYIVAGHAHASFWLIKTDSNGNEEWNKKISSPYAYNIIHSVKQTSDGGYITAGVTGGWPDPSGYTSAVSLIKTDSEGNVEWNKAFRQSLNNWAGSIQQTLDGGYIVAGYSGIVDAGSIRDIWLIKTDSNGNKEWNKTFDYFDNDDVAHSVQQTIDNGYILVGYTGSYWTDNYDIWLIKTDSNGDEEWNKTFGGSDSDFAHSVQQTTDNGYILAGSTGEYGPGDSDFLLIKTDSNGEEEWNKTFGGSDRDVAYSIQQTSDGGYIVTGWTESFGTGPTDFWLIKTDSDGIQEWSQTFGGSGRDQAYSVQQTSDKGYIVAGYTGSFGMDFADFWLIKLEGYDPDSDVDGVPDEDDLCPNTVLPESIPTKKLNVNHCADVDGDSVFETREKPKEPIVDSKYTLEDTYGCSCEQILELKPGMNLGEKKFGCEKETLEVFIDQRGWAKDLFEGELPGRYGVNLIDFSAFAEAWTCREGQSCWNEACDLHDDGVIDLKDLAIFTELWLADITP